MLDSFDYKEPSCVLCGGKEFYNPKPDSAKGRIPLDRIISKVDSCFNKNDYNEVGRLLEFWLNEAINLNDKAGELSLQSELVGFYRKTNQMEKGVASIQRALVLAKALGQEQMASGATIFLNCATAYKAFGNAEKALPLYVKCKEIYEKTLKNNDVRFAGLYNNMALTLVDLGEFYEAEQCYFNAIKVLENNQNQQADLAITYVNLAHLYDVKGLYDKITDCLFKAHELLNDELMNKNGYYAFVCEKCAPSFDYFGYKIIAEELRKSSKDIYERSRNL